MKKNQRVLFVGDVHGCFDELKELIEKLSLVPGEDRLIFLGDIINKGPASLEVLEFVHSIPCEVILGNHELALTRYARSRQKGHAQFDQLLRAMGKKKSYYLDWMNSLPLFIEGREFICVHGGFAPGEHFRKQDPRVLTRIRTWSGSESCMDNPLDPPWYDYYRGKKLVVYGHWAAKGLNIRRNTIGLDSGCVWGGALSALILPEKKIVQVKAKKVYQDIV